MKAKQSTLSLAIGSAFAASLIAVPAAHASNNPFAMQQLQNGYMVADAKDAKPADAKAGEGKCGGKKEGNMKAKEGKCGNTAKMKDGKCGEGKCGGTKKEAKPADTKAQGAKKPDDKAAAPAAK